MIFCDVIKMFKVSSTVPKKKSDIARTDDVKIDEAGEIIVKKRPAGESLPSEGGRKITQKGQSMKKVCSESFM